MKKVKIYTWTFCPFCVEAKNILKKKNIAFEEIVIDGDQKALSNLTEATDCSTVPQIFVGEKFIGGCDDLKALIEKKSFEEIFN
ncbi:MAG TPA: glutaredoxin 3 [Clostridia bacterium]|nr:glutaredoxin 3 [Clostridia bacterium]